MIAVTQITRINGVAVSAKFSSGVIRHFDTPRGEWLASERETAAITDALQVNAIQPYYYRVDNVGEAKYTVSYHDGETKHFDGSDFVGLCIFKSLTRLKEFTNELDRKGYIVRSV